MPESESYRQGHQDGTTAANAILVRPDLTARQKRRILAKIRKPLEAKRAVMTTELNELDAKRSILSELVDWMGDDPDRIDEISGARSSRVHSLLQAHADRRLLMHTDADESLAQQIIGQVRNAQIFIIQHDWATAFDRAIDFHHGEIRLPADEVVFEARLSGKHVAALLCECEGSSPVVSFIVECADGWCVLERQPIDFSRQDTPHNALLKQVRAICIALDAEVATAEVVRAPHRLNAARVKKGKLPIYDYHIVKLAGRSVAKPLDGPHGTHRSPRLHFRRGHWRHFEKFKTWIRWTLVGNPDLGFIDKEYRL